jgi:RNA polymerase-binding transcription factor DksA
MDERILEIAETQVEAEKEAQIQRIRAGLPTPVKNFDGRCLECGEIINEKRVQLGYTICIECRQLLDEKAKHFRGEHQEMPYDLILPLLPK